MKISRKFTTAGQDVYDSVEWSSRTSRIVNADGSVVFEMKDAEIPASWSQLATDIMVSKYFRKAGVPQVDADGAPVLDGAGEPVTGPERSVRQVVHRLVGCWTHWGRKHGYFDSKKDAKTFYDELAHMLLNQMAAPNSPQWFNTGLNFAYGISGPAQGHWIAEPKKGRIRLADDAYTHPQPHACFIQSVNDDLVGEGGIMDLWTREARLFKYGSGTGTNFSSLRGESEPLSGGGRSSGLMSFLRIGDRAAGAIKSGGTTRRAAKMVCLDVDHPDIVPFVRWKVREELKVAALVEGMKHLSPEQRDLAKRFDLSLDYDFNGESYYTVSGQNSNNSVRLSNEFLDAVDADGDWNLVRRTDGKICSTIRATELWEEICFSAWRCADPGVQYDSTINEWHTCPAAGRINASNPCSEYMFLDNTACNLASINVMRFYDPQTRTFDLDGYEHAVRLWTIVLEISVLMASFPSAAIAELSWRYRTLGLGYANLGAMLMQAGIPYDSDEGRGVCASLTAILTGRSYATSAEMAKEHGPFAGYEENGESMLRVVRNHRRAAHGVDRDAAEWESLRIRPVPIDHSLFGVDGARPKIGIANAPSMLDRAITAWDDALDLGTKYGYRNAQVTVIAPTGTIGLLMDCDTTGVEPDFSLTKFKKLAGGGYFKIANQSLRPALKALGYEASQIDEILRHVMGTLSLDVPMPDADGTFGDDRPATTLRQFLIGHGYDAAQLVALENGLPQVFELRFAFSAWSIPETIMQRLGEDPVAARNDPSFNGLRALGLTRAQIATLNRLVCGTQTVEGAPHLREEHLSVFDCANRCGPTGQRFIAPEGHIHMMAAAQPFISGAISKTINLPQEATVEQIAACYRLSWELGLKANALYRDGCKLSQPLNSKSDESADDAEDDEESGAEEARGEVAGAVIEAASTIAATVASDRDAGEVDGGSAPTEVVRIVERVIERPMRRRLPDTRRGVTHRFNVAGHEGYLTVGLYTDGTPGELFITMAKEGSTIGGLMDSLGTAISVALQYGVPLKSLVKKFEHQRFEPMGMTQNREIPIAKSLVDYIFRWLGMEFIPGYREDNAPSRQDADDVEVTPKPMRKSTATKPGASSAHAGGSRSEPASGRASGSQPDGHLDDRAAAHKSRIHTIKEDDQWSHSDQSLSGGSPTSAPHANPSRGATRSRTDATDGATTGRSSAISSPASPGATGSGAIGTGASPSASHRGAPDSTGASSSTSASATVTMKPATDASRASMEHSKHHQTTVVTNELTESTTIVDGDIVEERVHFASSVTALDQANNGLMGDAPACGHCGAITVRSGSCYKCLNCGSQNGCS